MVNNTSSDSIMGASKELFMEQNREGMGIQWEPYIFKLIVRLAYNGQVYTFFGDTTDAIEQMAQHVFKQPVVLVPSKVVFWWHFAMEDIDVPCIVIETQNPRYR